jgi:fibronectin type 3 domain-containing protein
VATADGAMVEWEKKDTTAQVELDRLPVGANGAAVEPVPAKTAPKASSKSLIKKQMAGQQTGLGAKASTRKVGQSPPAPVEVKLRTPAELADAGGTIDRTAEMGGSYRYTAQRVRTVSLDGHKLELRSFASGPATVVMRNQFAPHAPAGLEAAPGGARVEDRSIDLSWTPNTERDLAGYIVYRQEIDAKGVAAGTATRLNPTPVAGPAYRDQTAVAGRRYAYFITAINTAGNESAPSEAVQETLREQ